MTVPSKTDRPFGCPPDTQRGPMVHVLELPVPPSTNHIWRTTGSGKGYKSKIYTTWLQHADMAILVDGKVRGRKTIAGDFKALVEVRKPRSGADLDNRIKAVMDFAQSREFISNDKYLVEITARWSHDTIRGCRLTLTETPA